MDENLKRQLESLDKRIEEAESNVNAAKNILKKIYEDYLRVDYTQVDGELGKFNGFEMVTEDGKKFEVNENYAAKSKLVYGDILKLINEDGRNIFKQIDKVEKERVEGIMTKKEGEWYLLTDRGSYKVSDAAAEFHKAELNSQAVAYLPADNLDAPFATLDTVEAPSVIESKKEQKKTKDQVDKKTDQKEENIKDRNKKEMDLKKKTKTSPTKKTAEKPKLESKSSTKKSKPGPKTTSKSSKRTTSKKPTRKASPKTRSKSSSSETEQSSGGKKVLDDDDLV